MILVETCDLWHIGVQNIPPGLNSLLLLEYFTSLHMRIFVIVFFSVKLLQTCSPNPISDTLFCNKKRKFFPVLGNNEPPIRTKGFTKEDYLDILTCLHHRTVLLSLNKVRSENNIIVILILVAGKLQNYRKQLFF